MKRFFPMLISCFLGLSGCIFQGGSEVGDTPDIADLDGGADEGADEVADVRESEEREMSESDVEGDLGPLRTDDVDPGGCEESCDDGLDCTIDTCNASTGLCENELKSDYCLIGAGCYYRGDLHPDNSCLSCQPMADTGAWSGRQGEPCDDGQFCTVDDTCGNDGTCEGTDRTCDDTLNCTSDRCDEASDECVFEISVDYCLIGDECMVSGECGNSPSTYCLCCFPNMSQVELNLAPTGMNCGGTDCCNDAGECGEFSVCM